MFIFFIYFDSAGLSPIIKQSTY